MLPLQMEKGKQREGKGEMEPGDEHIREQGGASIGERPWCRFDCDGIDLTALMLIRSGETKGQTEPMTVSRRRCSCRWSSSWDLRRGLGLARAREREWRRLCGVLAEDEGE